MGNAPFDDEVPFTMNDTIWQKLNDIMCSTISINEFNQLYQPHVFPNPAENKITVELKEESFAVRIFDFTGKEIYSEKNCREKVQIDCSAFANGVYYLQLQTDKGSTMTKFSVSH
jgi:hypothetical protein